MMKKFSVLSFQFSVVAIALFLLSAIASAQGLQQSGGAGSSVAITQGGNTASVGPAGALKTNLGEVGGTAVDTNSGNKSPGTLRVVLATDQPQLTQKLLVTPDANSSVNVNQVGGTAIDTNSGNKSAGTQRVVIATDQPSLSNGLPVSENGTWNVGLNAGANLIGKTVPATTCGTTSVGQALAVVPTTATAVFTATTCLFTALFNNTNASTQTVTLTDNAGTPVNGVGPAFVIPGLSNLILSFGGIPFTSGVKWTAGGTGVTGGMTGFQ